MTRLADGTLAAQMDRVERARAKRRERYVLRDARITLSHGSGGKASHHLIDGLIVPLLGDDPLLAQDDSALIALDSAAGERLAFTTDSYVVSPLFFPGGDIGSLAVHGTINDLATAGARPIALSLALIIEEGLDVGILRRVLMCIQSAAATAGVKVVTGDTKVVPRGKADGLFITTTGVGVVRPSVALSSTLARPGDRVLLSGAIGDHGIAVMLAREALDIEADVRSDSAPLHRMAAAILEAAPNTRCLKDPTRGGVATSLNEIAQASGVAIAVDEARIVVHTAVRGACEMLGLDPLHIANEGKLVAIVAPDEAQRALDAMRREAVGHEAAIVGEILAEPDGMVVLRTDAGGSRVLDMLVGDPLPRIC